MKVSLLPAVHTTEGEYNDASVRFNKSSTILKLITTYSNDRTA